MGIEEKLPSGVLLTSVEKAAGWARARSVWPATFGLACCAIELMMTGGPKHDLARFGMERASNTPRQADLMIVAGRVSQKMAPVTRQIYDQMSDPKWVISMGVCASSGGMFNNYAIVQGVDHIIPVDIYLPGCPPRPEMLLDAILKLHDKIMNIQARQEPRPADHRARGSAAGPDATAPGRTRGIRVVSEPQDSHPAGAEATHGSAAPQGPVPPAGAAQAGEGSADAGNANLPALLGQERLAEPVIRTGMFGVQDTPDTSGFGLLRVHQAPGIDSPRPYGSYFDAIADALSAALEAAAVPFSDAIERVVADRGELTFHVRRERLPEVAAQFRDDPALRFEVCSGVSGVHYLDDTGRELHAVYHMLSITHNRRVRLEVSAPDADPHIPSLVGTYPACNWHERETWDFFGIIFDGHPALTRIEMPDDWKGHPQRKDYPLGGIPVEYRGAKIPAPDERRHYS